MICHAEFFFHEKVETYIAALMIALAKRGLPRKLYVDNGPAFRSHLLSHATAALGIALIHAAPYQPQGKGKIERFFRTLRTQLLSTCPAGLSLEKLNEALRRWIDEQYHATVHTSTKQTPLARYLKHAHLVREAPKDLRDYFRFHAIRKVDRDRTVSLNGKLYEAPVALIGKRVEILYHENDSERIEIRFGKQSYGYLQPVDIHINCRVKRHNHKTVLEAPNVQKTYRGGRLWSGKKEASHE